MWSASFLVFFLLRIPIEMPMANCGFFFFTMKRCGGGKGKKEGKQKR